MNQQSFGQTTGRATPAGPDGSSGSSAGTGQPEPANGKPGSRHQAVLGHFTLRDLTVFAATLILFVTSLLPVFLTRFNLWNVGNLFFLGLGIVLPLIVSALFAARRLTPATKVRIGSLSVDQFASVVASFAVAFFFLSVAGDYHPALLAGLIGSIVLFAATVLGRFIPYFASDFEGREETPAHVVARDSAVPLPKPHAPKAPKEPKAQKEAKAASGAWPAGERVGAMPGATGATGVAAGPAAAVGSAAAGSSAVSGSAGLAGSQAVTTPGSSPFAPSQQSASQPSVQPAQEEQLMHSEPTVHSPRDAQPVQPAAGSAGVSSAPEVAEWPSEGDFGPPTQAADVVPPAVVAAADEAPAAAPAPAAAQAPKAAQARQASEPMPATAVHPQVRQEAPIGATVDPASRPEESDEQPVHEAFWFAVAQHRTAVDPQTGAPAFVIEPGGWVLALEDRGNEFLVQHTDGRVGVLRDLSNIERG